MDKPTHVFEESGSLWAFYNYVTLALQVSHPKTWMEDQRVLHYFISSIIGSHVPVAPTPVVEEPVSAPVVDPNQLSLLDQIAEVEAEEVIDRNIAIEEVVHYTDAVGNTFEAPVVPPCAGHDAETVKDLEDEILFTEVENFFEEVDPQPSLEPTPEEYEEANLDLIQPVIEPVIEMEEANFDLDFTSVEDEDDDVAFEF
jgi:hypothetical protein